jgi:hypothetical protein
MLTCSGVQVAIRRGDPQGTPRLSAAESRQLVPMTASHPRPAPCLLSFAHFPPTWSPQAQVGCSSARMGFPGASAFRCRVRRRSPVQSAGLPSLSPHLHPRTATRPYCEGVTGLAQRVERVCRNHAFHRASSRKACTRGNDLEVQTERPLANSRKHYKPGACSWERLIEKIWDGTDQAARLLSLAAVSGSDSLPGPGAGPNRY